MSRLLLSILLILTFSPLSYVFAQQKVDRKIENVTESEVSSPIPVVFGKKNDGWPEKMKVRGIISEISFSVGCGVILWSGTLKIELLDRIEGYPYEYVFVVVNCLEDSQNEAKYLNKVVEMDVSKLYPKYRKYRGVKTFYCELINNTINSSGMPFYCTNMWRDEILKNIEQQAK
jgi:hypothetical protein